MVTPMSIAFDPRLIEIDIIYGDQKLTFDSSYAIHVTGTFWSNELSAECTVKIYNLQQQVRDTVISKTSPLITKRELVTMNVRAGRENGSVMTLFTGTVGWSSITQPPDICLTLQAYSLNIALAAVQNFPVAPNMELRAICQQIAQAAGYSLEYNAQDRKVANFFYYSVNDGIKRLNQLGYISAFVWQGALVVNDFNTYGNKLVQINQGSNMVGIPTLTERGVVVTTMFDPAINIGNKMQITSKLNPAANGTYGIFKMSFDLATRETPFYWIIEGILPALVGQP